MGTGNCCSNKQTLVFVPDPLLPLLHMLTSSRSVLDGEEFTNHTLENVADGTIMQQ